MHQYGQYLAVHQKLNLECNTTGQKIRSFPEQLLGKTRRSLAQAPCHRSKRELRDENRYSTSMNILIEYISTPIATTSFQQRSLVNNRQPTISRKEIDWTFDSEFCRNARRKLCPHATSHGEDLRYSHQATAAITTLAFWNQDIATTPSTGLTRVGTLSPANRGQSFAFLLRACIRDNKPHGHSVQVLSQTST